MDFNLKGKFLAGNIYHQFESICRDVDEFVTKDTLKFVEDRVQGVGMTVKRFYTNVVQDILPLSEDCEKPKSQLVDAEQVDMQDHVPVTGINTKGSIHTLGDSDASLPVEFDHKMQISEPPCGDISPGEETSLQGAESGEEEDITRDSKPVTTDSCLESFDNNVFAGVSNEDHKHYVPNLAHEVDLTTVKEAMQHFDHKTQISEPACGDISPGQETSLQGAESGEEEDITRDSKPVTADSCLESLDNNVFSEVSNEDHKHSAQTPDHEVDLTVKEETQHFDHKTQISEPACGDLSPGEETSVQGAESGVKEDITRDSISVTTDSCLESLDNNVFSGVSNEDHKHYVLSLAHEVDLTTVKDETQHFDHKMQISEPSCGDLSPGGETSLPGEEGGVEEGIARESKPVTTNSCLESLDNIVFSGVSKEDHKHSAPIPANEVDLTIVKEETQHFDHQKGNKCDLYDPECLSDSSMNGKLALNEEQNRYFDENGSLSSTSVSSANKVNEDNSLLMDSPLPSACDVDASALVKDKEKSDHFTTKDDHFHVSTSVKSPPESVLSHLSWKEKEAEMGMTPHCCCVTESTFADSILKSDNICPIHSKRDGMTPHCCVTESTSADSVLRAENIWPVHSKRDGFGVNISTPSFITAPDDTKDVDVLPSITILKLNDDTVNQTDESELENASSDRHKHHKDGHSEILMSPSETANICGDFDMETIDLSSDLKDNGTIPVSQSSCVHAASRRRSFRYYKNLIHDAFTYQKRISKEYEHLAILHGDIDMDSNQRFLNTHEVKTQSSEWELI